jgi:hypothetical protein
LSILGKYFSIKFLRTPEFRDLSPVMKGVHMMGTLFFKMNTYVIGFCFMDSAVIASGLAFNGYSADGKALHDRV